MKTANLLFALVLGAITLNLLLAEIASSATNKKEGIAVFHRGTADSPMCVDHAETDIGTGIISQPGKPLVVSVRFLERMDVSSKLMGELVIPGSSRLFRWLLREGTWHDGGFTWRFAPIKLGSDEGIGKFLLGGGKTSNGLTMMDETFLVCVGSKPLLDRLQHIAEWMIKNPHKAIFVEGYNYRTLLGLYEITGQQRYLQHVRRWADWLLADQKPEGYWGAGYGGAVFFADTGSALGLLINFYKFATPTEQKRIDAALQRYVHLLFVRGDNKGRSFVHEDGSLGVGYKTDEDGNITKDLNKPYTISTALTGTKIFAAMYYITGDERYKHIAIKACDWLLDTMAPSGQIPYYIEDWNPGGKNENWVWQRFPYNTSSYVGEGFIAAWTYIDDHTFRKHLADNVQPHIEWLLRTQNDDGSWARKGWADQLRSHGVVNLLLWYHLKVQRDPRIVRAIRKYCLLLLDEKRCRYLEVPGNGIATSLAGRALVEVIKPGVDCYRWKKQ